MYAIVHCCENATDKVTIYPNKATAMKAHLSRAMREGTTEELVDAKEALSEGDLDRAQECFDEHYESNGLDDEFVCFPRVEDATKRKTKGIAP